jgi:hypothetical protein
MLSSNNFFNLEILVIEDNAKGTFSTDDGHYWVDAKKLSLHLLIFLNLTKIIFTKKVHKTRNTLLLRLIGGYQQGVDI